MLSSSYGTGLTEAGCDEAGRGCLAGPVVAAAVILPDNYTHEYLNDSKKLSTKQRYALKDIIQKKALSWAVSFVDHTYIDTHNILSASIEAMHRAIRQLSVKPGYLLIDGNKFKPCDDIPYTCIVKGDSKYLSIAAASVLAKTSRDAFMEKIGKEFPAYQWHKNKGYPTPSHIKAYRDSGPTPYHRKSFRLNSQLRIKF